MKIERCTSYEALTREWKKEDLWDAKHPVRAYFKRLYRNVRAFILNIPDLPRDGYRKVKRGLQRGYRGWADEDLWGFDGYLSVVISEGLKRLKETKTGTPLVLETDCDNPDDYDGQWYKDNESKWNYILNEMIYAFEMNRKICEGEREGYVPTVPSSLQDMNFLTLKEEVRRRRGMLFFTQHFFSLWD